VHAHTYATHIYYIYILRARNARESSRISVSLAHVNGCAHDVKLARNLMQIDVSLPPYVMFSHSYVFIYLRSLE
jgi:hypothetical protein